jgi:RNA polymerase sigma factor (sigma-70 family)
LIAITTNRNFGLTEEQFGDLLGRLRQGDESLFTTLFQQHFKGCMGILTRKYRAPHEEAYDCVMWAMMRMRQVLIEDKVGYGNLESYMIRMAVNHYLKKQERNKEVSTESMPEPVSDHSDMVDTESIELLDRAWGKMGEKCQELLKGFYYDKIELKKLTALLGDTSESNTRKRKERCLQELRMQFFRFYNS